MTTQPKSNRPSDPSSSRYESSRPPRATESYTLVDRLFVKFVMTGCALVLTLFMYIGYTMFADYKLFTAPAVWPMLSEDRTVQPGGDIMVDLHFCKHTNLPADIGRMIVGRTETGKNYLVVLPAVTGWFPPSCQHRYTAVAQAPYSIPAGTYTVVVTITYHYNVFRTVSHRFTTAEWHVKTEKATSP